MTLRAFCLASIAALAIVAAPAHAQSPAPDSAARSGPSLARVRHGFFASLGFGYGSAEIHCAQCTSGRGNGASGILQIGGTLSPHVRLGVESTGWYKDAYGVEAEVEPLSAVLYYYPSLSNNFWIKGGGGYAHSHADDDFEAISQDGAGITFGVGYDLPFGGSNFVLIPYAAYVRQISGKINSNGTHTDVSSNANVLQLGVGLGFRH